MGRRFFSRVRSFKMRAMRRLAADTITRALRPPESQAAAVRAALTRRILRSRPRTVTTMLTQIKPLQGLLPMDLKWASGFVRVGKEGDPDEEEAELRAAAQGGDMAGEHAAEGVSGGRLWRQRHGVAENAAGAIRGGDAGSASSGIRVDLRSGVVGASLRAHAAEDGRSNIGGSGLAPRLGQRHGGEAGPLVARIDPSAAAHADPSRQSDAVAMAVRGLDAGPTTTAVMRPETISVGLAAALREPARLLVGRRQAGAARRGLAMGAAAGFGSGGWDVAAVLRIAQRESGVQLPLFETGAAEPERAQLVLKEITDRVGRPGVWLPRTVVQAGRSMGRKPLEAEGSLPRLSAAGQMVRSAAMHRGSAVVAAPYGALAQRMAELSGGGGAAGEPSSASRADSSDQGAGADGQPRRQRGPPPRMVEQMIAIVSESTRQGGANRVEHMMNLMKTHLEGAIGAAGGSTASSAASNGPRSHRGTEGQAPGEGVPRSGA